MKKTLLYICGIMNLLFGVLHLSFWKRFHWEEELGRLSRENSGIIQMFNVESLFFLLFASFITFHLANKEAFSFTDKAVLILFAGYYIIRIVFGYPYFGFNLTELIVWVVCAVVAVCYVTALKISPTKAAGHSL